MPGIVYSTLAATPERVENFATVAQAGKGICFGIALNVFTLIHSHPWEKSPAAHRVQ